MSLFNGPVAWQLYFWLMAALIVLPLPWKVWEYARGKDKSPTVVKIEEMVNAGLFAVGLVGLYGYMHGIKLANEATGERGSRSTASGLCQRYSGRPN